MHDALTIADRRFLRRRYLELVASARRKKWASVKDASQAILDLLPAPIERWYASGIALRLLGEAELVLDSASKAKMALESSLRCTLIDIRDVLPTLAEAAWRCGDNDDARGALYELLVAAGEGAVPAGEWAHELRVALPAPPSGKPWPEHVPLDPFWLIEEIDESREGDFDPLYTGGKLPLHVASDRGDGYTVKKLVLAGADVNAPWKDGDSVWLPIHGVTYRDRPDLVRLLLEHGASVIAPRHSLICQARSGAMARLLIERGARISEVGEQDPLLVAVQMRRPEVVEELLRAGADSSILTEEGFTLIEFTQRFAKADEGAKHTLDVLLTHQARRRSN
jgi:Ankyrin repeat